jgi:hypothetical protein
VKQIFKGLDPVQSAKYQIKVQGRLREGWTDWFDEMLIDFEQNVGGPTITTLTGMVQDQAALHGIRYRQINLL